MIYNVFEFVHRNSSFCLDLVLKVALNTINPNPKLSNTLFVLVNKLFELVVSEK
jgi:hypothetical protein